VIILVNDGKGRFSYLNRSAPRTAPRLIHAREAAVKDFNGDNINDLFVAAHGLDRDPFPGEANLLMLSNGRGGLTDVSGRNLEPLSAMNHGVVAHDVDGDGDTDLLVITNGGANTIDPYFLINDGHGKFTRSDEPERLTPSLRIFLEGRVDRSKSTTARFADVNADGYSDLIFAISGDDGDKASRYSGMRKTRVVLNDGNYRWLRENAFELPVRRWGYWTYTTDVDSGDVDGDGDIDLLLTESTADPKSGRWRGQYHQLLLNDGGNFTDVSTTHLWKQGYADMTDIAFPIESFLVDLDLDKDLDIVVRTIDPTLKGADHPRTVVALNDGTGHFSAVDPASLTSKEYEARQLRPVDVDGDGDLDLVGLRYEGRMVDGVFYTGGFTVQVLRNQTRKPENE
jgi:FG-GAP-like repeat